MDVSIVMSCKNSDLGLLKIAINSVLRQTLSNFELIIVDDGSENPMDDFIKSFNDNRIRYFKISSSGLGAALNFGIKHAKSNYIARLDDDDAMVSSRLQKQYDFMQKNSHCVCVGTQIFLKSNSRFLKYRCFSKNNYEILRSIISFNWFSCHSALFFRKDIFSSFGGYRISGGGQDMDLFLQFGLKGEISIINEYLTYYHLSLQGLSVSNNAKKFKAYLFAFKAVKDEPKYIKLRPLIMQSINFLEKKIEIENNKKVGRKNFKKYFLYFFTIFFGANLILENNFIEEKKLKNLNKLSLKNLLPFLGFYLSLLIFREQKNI